jgi:hypothetical protein
MARLKRTETAPPDPRDPLPEHTRTPEWNGFTQGDEVVVRLPGKKARKGYRYYFSNHVISPEGHEYIDVREVKLGFANGLWRSFPPEAISAPYVPKNPRRKTA